MSRNSKTTKSLEIMTFQGVWSFLLFLDTLRIQGILSFLLFLDTFGKGWKVYKLYYKGWKVGRWEGWNVGGLEGWKVQEVLSYPLFPDTSTKPSAAGARRGVCNRIQTTIPSRPVGRRPARA